MIDWYVNDIILYWDRRGGCDHYILGDRGRQEPISVGMCG